MYAFLYATCSATPPTRFSCAGRKARVGFCERQLTGEQVGVFIYCGALTEARGHVQPATTRVVRRSLYEYRTVLNLSLINDFVIPLSVAFRPRAPRPTEPPRTGAASAAGPELELVPGWVKGIDALESLSCFLPLQCTRSMFPSKERVIARNYY